MMRWTRFILAVSLLALMACSSARETAPPPTSPELVKGGAVFRYRNPDAKSVHLVGDFNQWNPTSDPMEDTNSDGEWTLFYPLQPGRYAYKFVVDGKKWIPDPVNTLSEPDGFDGRNSIVVVPAGVTAPKR